MQPMATTIASVLIRVIQFVLMFKSVGLLEVGLLSHKLFFRRAISDAP